MDIFEILVPLIFAAIYFFGNMFSKKEEDDGLPGQEPRPRRGEGPEAVERQRRIQEEIRRKIRERRQAEQGDGSRTLASESAQRDETQADRRLRERRVAAEQRRAPSEPMIREPEPIIREAEPVARSADGAFSWDQSDDIYGNEMEARLKKIEATKRQAEKLQRQAAAKRDSGGSAKGASARRGGALLQGSVIESLRSANAARTAFIYGEVLGPPISRRQAQTVPGLER
jgi:hypothetical protein